MAESGKVCASEEEMDLYYGGGNIWIELLELRSFIDYRNVKAEPLEKLRLFKMSV